MTKPLGADWIITTPAIYVRIGVAAHEHDIQQRLESMGRAFWKSDWQSYGGHLTNLKRTKKRHARWRRRWMKYEK